jgi:hypothetical protein
MITTKILSVEDKDRHSILINWGAWMFSSWDGDAVSNSHGVDPYAQINLATLLLPRQTNVIDFLVFSFKTKLF